VKDDESEQQQAAGSALRQWSAIVAVAALRTRAYLCAPCFLSIPLFVHPSSIHLSVRSFVRPSVGLLLLRAAAALSPFALRVRCTEISLYLSTTVGEEASPACHRLLLSLSIATASETPLLPHFSSLLWPRPRPTHTTVAAQAARIDRGWLCLSVVQCNCKPLQFASMHPAVSWKGKKKRHLF
jgi:hypothetical protein